MIKRVTVGVRYHLEKLWLLVLLQWTKNKRKRHIKYLKKAESRYLYKEGFYHAAHVTSQVLSKVTFRSFTGDLITPTMSCKNCSNRSIDSISIFPIYITIPKRLRFKGKRYRYFVGIKLTCNYCCTNMILNLQDEALQKLLVLQTEVYREIFGELMGASYAGVTIDSFFPEDAEDLWKKAEKAAEMVCEGNGLVNDGYSHTCREKGKRVRNKTIEKEIEEGQRLAENNNFAKDVQSLLKGVL